jgi:hypothetical protein
MFPNKRRSRGQTSQAPIISALRRLGNRRPPRNIPNDRTMTIVRSTAQGVFTLVTGALSSFVDFNLGLGFTTDLVGQWDQYRVNWVEFIFTPEYDPGQSGVTNNAVITVYTANDPAGHYTAPNASQIGAFTNHKVTSLVATKVGRYRFKPKPVNTLAGGNFANSNDWLQCTASGVAVAHQRLLIAATTQVAADVLSFTGYYRYSVTLKGVY